MTANNQQYLPLEIYTEMTPNPETMKFVTNRKLLPEGSVEFKSMEEASVSPLATGLLSFPFVDSVFISGNFIAVTRRSSIDWYEIIPSLREFIKQHLDAGKPVLEPGVQLDKKNEETPRTDRTETESRIIELLETYVKPAVENDGGAIEFKSFDNGVVTLKLKGACSGCPSSIITLKAGIEGLLQRMVPEVKEVVAEAE